MTIPSNAAHPKQAANLIAFLLGTKGNAIMQANHHPLIMPPQTDHLDRLPQELRSLCVPLQ